jgi:hypothetical protein
MAIRLSELHHQRNQALEKIRQRREHLGELRRTCLRHSKAWARTPRAPLQAFVAGFMLDQVRPLIPEQTSPVQLALLVMFRRLETIVRQGL